MFLLRRPRRESRRVRTTIVEMQGLELRNESNQTSTLLAQLAEGFADPPSINHSFRGSGASARARSKQLRVARHSPAIGKR